MPSCTGRSLAGPTRGRTSLALATLLTLLATHGALSPSLHAQERPFCDAEPCTDDRLAVVFPLLDVLDTSDYRYQRFTAGMEIASRVVLNAVSNDIRGWSFGVAHDPAFLALDPASLSVEGTILDAARPGAILGEGGFVRLEAVAGGYTAVVSLSNDAAAVVLPVRRHVVAKATYFLDADPGVAGTALAIDDTLGAPATAVTIERANAMGGGPRTVVDGLIRRIEIPPEICDNGIDDDGDRLIDLLDPECIDCVCPPDLVCLGDALYFGSLATDQTVELGDGESFAISSRNARPLTGFQFGVRIRTDGGVSTFEFAGDLASEPGRPLSEIIFTDTQVNIIAPEIGNQLTANASRVDAIERGSALTAFNGQDLLAFDLEPEVNGPGFFVGYIASLGAADNRIPATEPGDPCPLNELLVIRLRDGGADRCDLPPNGLFFGSVATMDEHDAGDASRLVVSSRNAQPLTGFQFGVRTSAVGDSTRYEFAGDLASLPGRPLSEILFTDLQVNIIEPATLNTAIALRSRVAGIERGTALATFAADDILAFDLAPEVGGPGFFVGYIADSGGGDQVIPATADTLDCPGNELLVLRLVEEGGVEVCDDGVDNDGDLLVDCMDPDCVLFPGCVDEVCDDGIDNDGDGLIDCLDPDCAMFPGCDVEICDDGVDNDGDGLIDCADPDCAVFPGCGDEICDDGIDNDGDGLVDCMDPDCAMFPGCGDEICDDGMDNDGDGLVDCLDPDCDAFPGCADCPPNALYFGPVATTDRADARGEETFVISSHNAGALTAFQFGVAIRPDGDDFSYTFSGDLASEPGRPLSEVIFTDLLVNTIEPLTPNTLIASSDSVIGIERGATLAGFGAVDMLVFDLAPDVGGPGFFLGYIADSGNNGQVIPATPSTPDCPVNELLVIRLQGGMGGDCPDNALYFGPTATTATHDARAESMLTISSRNSRELTGFQFGVTTVADGDDYRFAFSGDLASLPGRPVSEIIFTDELVNILEPSIGNDALTASDRVLAIERGAAIETFSNADILAFDLSPEVGGPGFTVGYIAQSGANLQLIPATPSGGMDCVLNELLVIRFEDTGVCPDEALFFGLDARAGVFDARGMEEVHIGSRNQVALSGFQFGARATTIGGGATRFEFADDLASEPGRPLSEVIFTDRIGNIIVPQTRNTMETDFAEVTSVSLGATLQAIEPGGILALDLDPQVGGPGLIVGYIASLQGDERLIPVTPAGGDCGVNDLLVLSFAQVGDRDFVRGDTDGNGRHNINDAVEILLRLFAGKMPRFDCDDAFDADDNGAIQMQDAVRVIDRLFRNGPELPAPGLLCGADPTDDGLGCGESNCRP